MLRRKPTAITLTSEDVAIYEDTRATAAARAQAHLQALELQQEQHEQQHQQQKWRSSDQPTEHPSPASLLAHPQGQGQSQRPTGGSSARGAIATTSDPNNDLRPSPGGRGPSGAGGATRSREERIGLVGGPSARGANAGAAGRSGNGSGIGGGRR
ncbi:MAG: hypothetical protein M4579_006502 [Chaenotheca gracillima]|nr:MAG: hypothetical protein M4579_006502 [Chaenotheca gracillima]